MKKWRIWLRRTAWVAMGLVLMSGSVGISAKANAPSGNEPAMETESPGQTETEKGENTTSNGSKRFVIVEFEDLGAGVQMQELETGETPDLPDTLIVTAAVGEQKEETSSNGMGISKAVQDVTEIGQWPRVEKTVQGVEWEETTTSTLNNNTTSTYVPVIPTTDENGNSLELMPAMGLPMIQATAAGIPAETGGQNGSTPLEDDYVPPTPGTGTEYKKDAYGVTVTGPDENLVWQKGSGRILIEQPGTYFIEGKLDVQAVLDEGVQSANPFITLVNPGDYEIVLLENGTDPLRIDLTSLRYTRVLSIPDGANVKLSGKAELYCRTDAAQQVIENLGELEVLGASDIDCTGRILNNKKITIKGESTIATEGTFDNNGDLIIEESSEMETHEFTNNGTLEIKGAKRNGTVTGRIYSSLLTKGMLWNQSGRTVTIDGGFLDVSEGEPKDDGSIDWKIDNDGTIEIKNAGKAEAGYVINNSGSKMLVHGADSLLTAEAKLTTNGELAVNEMGTIKAKSLVNTGELAIGSAADSGKQGFVEITAGGRDNENTGKIVIEAGSRLYKTDNTGAVLLINNGSLTVKDEDSLGSGPTEIQLEGDGEFIFAGLYNDILQIPLGYGLAYTGVAQTQDVMGASPYILDSTLVTEEPDPDNPEDSQPVNKGGGVITIAKEREFHGANFDVKVKAQLDKIMLTRAPRAAGPDPVTGGWVPGIDAVVDDGTGNYTADVTSKGIFEPGEYKLIFENTEVPGQTASVGFTMTEWSMILETNQGADDVVKEKYPDDDPSDYAVYENKRDITCTVKVAIFNAKNAKGGKVTLYWNAFDAVNTDTPTFESKMASINLGAEGTESVTITIPTESEPYIIPPQLDPNSWETEDWAYEHPYKLTAVYEQKVEGSTDQYNWYHEDGTDTSDNHGGGLIKDHTNGVLSGWYADKKLIIIRQKPNLQFTSKYYTNSEGLLTYNGESLRMPVAQEDITYRSNQDTPDYTWYKGLESQVMEAYEKQTLDVSGLEAWVPSAEEVDEEGNPAIAPKDAGWYIIRAHVPATRDFIGESRLHYIHVEPKNLTVSVKDQHKPYGAKDPDEWSGFLISNDVNEAASDLYVVEGLLDIDNGKMKGEITRVDDDKGEECGRYEIKITAWAEDGDPTRDNYKIDTRKGIGTLTIDQRELEWDAEKLFLVITDDDTVSVVGGLKTDYRLVDGENKADVEDALKDDDVVAVYDKLDLSSDKGKITIDKLRLGGADKDNYVIQSKSFSVPANSVYKISVKTGTIDSTTMTKLKDHGTQYSTEDQVIKALESQLESQGAKRNNTAVYDIILTKANGDPLSEAEIEEFPWGALTVTVPFPAGTSRATSFAAAHMITEKTNLDGPNKSPGNLETRTWNQVATVEDGVRFQLESLSPIAIGWATTTNNPNNPNDPNGGNNGSNNGNNGTNGGTNGSGNGNQGNNSGNNNNNNNSNNKATNSNTTKATSSNATRTSGVKTGDPAQIAFYSIATLIACLLLILIIFLIRAQFRRKD